MDIVKQELAKKRQSLLEESGGRRFFKRSEMEQNRIQKRRREEDKRHADAKQNQIHPNSSNPNFKLHISSSSETHHPKPPLLPPKHEVIRRLRLSKHPVTLFGESDDDRLDRLKRVLQQRLFDCDMTEGQTNDFLPELRNRDDHVSAMEQNMRLIKRMKTEDFSELCDEDKILVFFNKLLIEWKQELDEMTQTEKTTAKGKSTFATFKQSARYLNPLFNLCKKKVLHDDIRQALISVVNCCMKGDNSAAIDHYIRIAIGNSAWPIGVTMVGIHERSAREKICTSSVAHVMNDETTRKYLTSVRRLITFCETRHQKMSSKEGS